MGGSAVAYALKDSCKSVLMIERGDFIPEEKENWDISEIVLNRRYAAQEEWLDNNNQKFKPRIYYNVGGNTKFFGGAALRLRDTDFRSRMVEDGFQINWPLDYEDLEPWYKQAEEIIAVRGQKGEDPSESLRGDYPFPPVEHESEIVHLVKNLKKQGLKPFHLPLAIASGSQGWCKKGSPCDGFPCMVRAKGDAENRFLRPLLNSDSNLTLLRNAFVDRLIPAEDGKSIKTLKMIVDGKMYKQKVHTVILSAGAVNSAALLLRSRDRNHPDGLANSSGMVGRNYISHMNTVMMAMSPFRKNPTVFQKTMAVNDYYKQGLGMIQLRGKIHPEMLQNSSSYILRAMGAYIAPRSIDLWLMTEDFPNPDNRVTVSESGQIKLTVEKNNISAHKELIQKARVMMSKAGYPVIFTEDRGLQAVQHQCGTVRFGNSPKSSPLDKWCRSFDIPNLFVVDGSFFPSSGAVNPALTIAAQGLRVGSYLKNQRMG
jgi:choline dehydrogenase-like flavoprotein